MRQHINHGKGLTRLTNLSVEEVVILVEAFIDGEILELNTPKYYGDENCDYFSMTKNYLGQIYKLVFCICSDRRETLGIITLHRSRRLRNVKL